MQKHKTGFSPLDTVLVVALMALLAVAGWFVWHNRSKATTTPTATTTTTTSTPSADTSDNVLEIKELGVKMTLPSGLKEDDVIYKTFPGLGDLTSTKNEAYHHLGSVELTTKSLIAQYPSCTITSDGQGQIIAFSKTQEDASKYSIASNSTDYTAVGSFYMSIDNHQSYCSVTADNADHALEDQQYKLFTQAFKTMQPL